MGSHVAALFLSYLVYQLARSAKFNPHFTFGTAKLYSLGGYTSAIGLAIIAVFMGYESILRFLNPVTIEFNEALLVCVIGLVVNLVNAWILNDDYHHHDHNHQSALAHVLADALTSAPP
jgi:cation diffusion facilitator family transporter